VSVFRLLRVFSRGIENVDLASFLCRFGRKSMYFCPTSVLGNLEDLGSTFSIFEGWLFAQVGSSPFWFSYGPILFMVYLYFVFNFCFIILICMCYDLNLKKNETVRDRKKFTIER
jgi:hypothetical protein